MLDRSTMLSVFADLFDSIERDSLTLDDRLALLEQESTRSKDLITSLGKDISLAGESDDALGFEILSVDTRLSQDLAGLNAQQTADRSSFISGDSTLASSIAALSARVARLEAIQPPPPPPPPPSDLPAWPGIVKVSDRSFLAKVEDGWQARTDSAFTIEIDPAALYGPNVGQALFTPALPGGSGPIQTYISPLPKQAFLAKKVCVKFRLKMDPLWFGNSSGVNKVLFLSINGMGNPIIVLVRGIGTGPLSLEVALQGMRVQTQTGVNADGTPKMSGVSWNCYSNLGVSSVIQRGAWLDGEVRFQLNTPGLTDGFAECFLNGVQTSHYTNVGFLGSTDLLKFFEGVNWNPTYGGGNPSPPYNMVMQIDRIQTFVAP